jgi:hypothetical protein
MPQFLGIVNLEKDRLGSIKTAMPIDSFLVHYLGNKLLLMYTATFWEKIHVQAKSLIGKLDAHILV